MNCADYTEWIVQALDGTLPADRRKDLEAHLAGCARCRAEWLLQERIREALVEEIPSGLHADFPEQVCRRALKAAEADGRAARWMDVAPALVFWAGAVAVVVFRHALAEAVPWLMETLSRVASAPLAVISDTTFQFFARIADLPREQIPALEQVSRPLMTTLTVTILGLVPTLWAFSRIFGFLRD